MAHPGKRGKKKKTAFVASIPGLIESALCSNDDLILTIKTDPDTGSRRAYAFTGKFISPCMMRKLIGLSESCRDEGSRVLWCDWR